MSNIYQEILNELKENRAVTAETRLAAAEGSMAESVTRRLTGVEPVEDAKGRRFARVSTQWGEDGGVTIREPVLPQERLIVLGGGHIALPVCEFGAKCGFNVCVVDDRPSFANTARFPLARQVLCESFETAIEKLADEYAGKAVVGKIDVDQEEDLAREFGIMSIPCVVILKDGAEYSRLVGARPYSSFAQALDEALS